MSTVPAHSTFPPELLPHKETIHLALLALLSGECELGECGICYYLAHRLRRELPSPQPVYDWVALISPKIAYFPQGVLTPERIALANRLISELESL